MMTATTTANDEWHNRPPTGHIHTHTHKERTLHRQCSVECARASMFVSVFVSQGNCLLNWSNQIGLVVTINYKMDPQIGVFTGLFACSSQWSSRKTEWRSVSFLFFGRISSWWWPNAAYSKLGHVSRFGLKRARARVTHSTVS